MHKAGFVNIVGNNTIGSANRFFRYKANSRHTNQQLRAKDQETRSRGPAI